MLYCLMCMLQLLLVGFSALASISTRRATGEHCTWTKETYRLVE
jgi:hypothetical protein